MTEFRARRHRLALPSMPSTNDPVELKRAMENMRRLVQDEFNRLATDFYDFKKTTFEAAIIPLRAPSQIAVTKDSNSASFTWELPDGDEITPTRVRVRIEELSPNTWAEYSWPLTSWETNSLVPGTQYTFQIQLIAEFEASDTFVSTTRNCPSVPVLRTAESDVISKVFTTDAGVGPPSDPGTNDDHVDFEFPPTEGTPGTAGGSDCYWGYQFQYRTGCAWVDTGSETEVDGDVGTVNIGTADSPFAAFTAGTVFRMKYREKCNSGATIGDWVYTEPFCAVDWSDSDCLGIPKSDSLTEAPYSTANSFAFPSACQADDTYLQVVDALSDTEFYQGTGFSCIEYIDGEWVVIAKTTAQMGTPRWQPMCSGVITGIDTLGDESDFTLSFTIKVVDAFNMLGAPATSYPIIEIGNKIRAYFIGTASDYQIMVEVPRDGGGAYQFRTPGLSYDQNHEIYYQHDTSEPDGRKLYSDSVLASESTNAIANDFTGITNNVNFYALPTLELSKCYFWKDLVTPLFDGLTLGDIYWEMAESGGPSFPLADSISSVSLSQTSVSADSQSTSAIDGKTLTAFDDFVGTASLGDASTFDGFAFGAMIGMWASTYTVTSNTRTLFSFKDNAGNESFEIEWAYTNPIGWQQQLRYWDDGNTQHTVNICPGWSELSTDNGEMPFLVHINSDKDTITIVNAMGNTIVHTVQGTGTLRESGGIQTLDIGDDVSAGLMGRLFIRLSEVTGAGEIQSMFWALAGGFPTSGFEVYSWLTGDRAITGTTVNFVIPRGASLATATLSGASGWHVGGGTGTPGRGHKIKASKTVSAGDALYLRRGGHGDGENFTGFNVHGNSVRSTNWLGGATTGGIASDRSDIVSTNSSPALSDRTLIAGGGGGCYGGGIGGDGGRPTGAAGSNSASTPGGGGTQSAGGSAGTGGNAGVLGAGGNGANGHGGDGYYGGGSESYASANDQAGGGGSSYINTGVWTLVSEEVDTDDTITSTNDARNGRIVIELSG